MKFNILYIIPTAIASLLTAACSEEQFIVETETGGHEAEIAISLAPKAYGSPLGGRSLADGEVDEGTGTDNAIMDLWIIEFDNKGKRIGTVRYFDDPSNIGAVSVIKPELPDVDYTLVAIANTGDSSLRDLFTSCEWITDLWKISYLFSSEKCGYTSDKVSGTKVLVMNGSMTLNSSSTSIEIPMYRNVAKLEIDITNKATSSVIIKQVRLCKVPNLISYADQKVAEKGEKMADKATVINLPFEEWSKLVSESTGNVDQTAKLIYYVPRNMQGNTESQSVLTKNSYAPASSTYLEIMANDAENGTALRYRFYLGKNMKNNFDVEPNCHYKLPVTISSKGDVYNDSRVESFNSNGVSVSSNSYIINYIPGHYYETVYIPVDRINYFWTHPNNIFGNKNNYKLDPSTKWVAEVIWQDTTEDIFHFCNPDGSEKQTLKHFYFGEGDNDFMTVKPTGNGPGNVLIGVRKDDPDWNRDTDGYMWSWHLWITDYNPNSTGQLNETTYNYAVDGGHVQRYDTRYWSESIPARDGIYIMDRNFGAHTADAPPLDEKGDGSATWGKYTGLYYTFGRKDPWPRTQTMLRSYVIDKNDQTKEIETEGVNFREFAVLYKWGISLTLWDSVRYPFICVSQPGASISGYAYQNWEMPGWGLYKGIGMKQGKSLFDPTPVGWRMPYKEECPSPDNFQNVSMINALAYYFRLNNNGTDQNDNYAIFPKSNGQWAVGGNSCQAATSVSSGILIQSAPKTAFNPPAWQVKTDAATGLPVVTTQYEYAIHMCVATRLIRDPSQD